MSYPLYIDGRIDRMGGDLRSLVSILVPLAGTFVR